MRTTYADSPAFQPADGELLASVRAGDRDAYGVLYRRHHPAALRLARQLARCWDDADDLVADAFTSTLRLLSRQLGPSDSFRPYLFTAIRHGAYAKTRTDGRLTLRPDSTELDVAVPFAEPPTDSTEVTLVRKAFDTLPTRWQTVLRLTEIGELSTSEAAHRLGLSPAGVSALAYRAREGLRRAYLRVHMDAPVSARCGRFTAVLPDWIRDGLSARMATQVRSHVDRCDRCTVLASLLRQANRKLGMRRSPSRPDRFSQVAA